MGWLFIEGTSKRDLITKLTSTEENHHRRWETLSHSVRGNVIWSVVELTNKDQQYSWRFITCYLLRSDRKYGWGYKEMEESMGPNHYSCPLKYLKMVPEANANANWREAVREYHHQRNRRVEIGQRISLVNATIPWVIITSTKPLLGLFNGECYRVPRRMLGKVVTHPGPSTI